MIGWLGCWIQSRWICSGRGCPYLHCKSRCAVAGGAIATRGSWARPCAGLASGESGDGPTSAASARFGPGLSRCIASAVTSGVGQWEFSRRGIRLWHWHRAQFNSPLQRALSHCTCAGQGQLGPLLLQGTWMRPNDAATRPRLPAPHHAEVSRRPCALPADKRRYRGSSRGRGDYPAEA